MIDKTSEQWEYFLQKQDEIEERTTYPFTITEEHMCEDGSYNIYMKHELDGAVEWLDLEMLMWQNQHTSKGDVIINCIESPEDKEWCEL